MKSPSKDMNTNETHDSTTIDGMIETALLTYSVADAAIAALAEEYMGLSIKGIDDDDGAKAVADARRHMVSIRTGTDRTRKDLNADAVRYKKAIDGEAKRITKLAAPIEKHLAGEIDRNDAEIMRIRLAEMEAKARILDGRMAQLAETEGLFSPHDVEKLDEEGFAALLEMQRDVFAVKQAERAELARLRKEEDERLQAAEDEMLEARRLKSIEDGRAAEELAAAAAKLEEERAEFESEKRSLARERRSIASSSVKFSAEETETKRLQALRPHHAQVILYAQAVEAIQVPDGPFYAAICSLRKSFLGEATSLGGYSNDY